MKIDLTVKVTPALTRNAQSNEKKAFTGHLGTHFDVMNKEFPLDYTIRKGIVFDVSFVKDRDIAIQDITIDRIEKNSFVAFYTGFLETVGYGNQLYFHQHPQLADELIDALLEKKISIIGIDFAGIKRGSQHPIKDQYCADHNVFVVENLCHLKCLTETAKPLTMYTFPMNFAQMTGLPCRVIAEI